MCRDRHHRRRRAVRRRPVAAGHGADGAAGLPLPAAGADHRDGGRRDHRVPDRRHGRVDDRGQLRLHRRTHRNRQASRARHHDGGGGGPGRRRTVRAGHRGGSGRAGPAAASDLRVGHRQRRRGSRDPRAHPEHAGRGRATDPGLRHGARLLACPVLPRGGLLHHLGQPGRLVGAVQGAGPAARRARRAQARAVRRHRPGGPGAIAAARRRVPLPGHGPRRAGSGLAGRAARRARGGDRSQRIGQDHADAGALGSRTDVGHGAAPGRGRAGQAGRNGGRPAAPGEPGAGHPCRRRRGVGPAPRGHHRGGPVTGRGRTRRVQRTGHRRAVRGRAATPRGGRGAGARTVAVDRRRGDQHGRPGRPRRGDVGAVGAHPQSPDRAGAHHALQQRGRGRRPHRQPHRPRDRRQHR